VREALERFAVDPEVRVLVLKGAGGKAFVSGADISKFETERSSEGMSGCPVQDKLFSSSGLALDLDA
jgi:enoyl-CoA hydratase/carnithine racemase